MGGVRAAVRQLGVPVVAVAVALVAAPAFGSPVTPMACPDDGVPDDGFGDVAWNHAHEWTIDCAVWWGVAAGRTADTFAPDHAVTRAQAASFVARTVELAGFELDASVDHFDDDAGPHEVRINELASAGIIGGTGPRTFSPDEPLSRAQMAALLARTYSTVTGEDVATQNDYFDDDAGLRLEPEINAAAERDLVGGVAYRTYDPGRPVSRAQMATFLTRLLEQFIESGALEAKPAGEGHTHEPAPLSDRPLATGETHSCAIVTDGTVRCWGANDYGQLGDGTTSERTSPVQVVGLTGVTSISAGWYHTCVTTADGNAYCWGYGELGQLGDGSRTNQSRPVKVSGLNDVTDVAGGPHHTCALTSGGEVHCWGFNGDNKFDARTTDHVLTPRQMHGLTGVTGIATGVEHVCVLAADATVHCWGGNTVGQLGDGTQQDRSTPVRVVDLTAVVDMAADGLHSCAVTADGNLHCWGNNESGQLGDGTTTNRSTPVKVAGLSSVSRVSAGGSHTCATMADGGAYCWGSNSSAQLGDDDSGFSPDHRTRPSKVVNVVDVARVSAGRYHTCAVTSDGTVYCWGNNTQGQSGGGGYTNWEPEKVPLK